VPDFVVRIVANLHQKTQHCSICIDRGLPATFEQTCKQTITKFASRESRLTVGQLRNNLQCYQLHIRKVDFANDHIKNFDPSGSQRFVFLQFIGNELD